MSSSSNNDRVTYGLQPTDTKENDNTVNPLSVCFYCLFGKHPGLIVFFLAS